MFSWPPKRPPLSQYYGPSIGNKEISVILPVITVSLVDHLSFDSCVKFPFGSFVELIMLVGLNKLPVMLG